jgi:hypothetical protein
VLWLSKPKTRINASFNEHFSALVISDSPKQINFCLRQKVKPFQQAYHVNKNTRAKKHIRLQISFYVVICRGSRFFSLHEILQKNATNCLNVSLVLVIFAQFLSLLGVLDSCRLVRLVFRYSMDGCSLGIQR